ncbi:DUF4349 domain-containing protein [Sorangium sp. So ce1335]|uniref:DUF4349 domain-containing protein n=1 Tax=Sorangium sp. So ce1335 TaxID=3133335 RepID=UPI003F5F316A
MPWSRPPRPLRVRASLSVALVSAAVLTGACARAERAPSAAMEPAAAPAPAATAIHLPSQGPSPGAPPLSQRAMRITVETTVLVDAFDPALQRLRAAVEEHGGYVSDARVHGGPHHSASLEARIPSARVGTFRAVVASVGEVVSDAEKAEDVTEQRADIGARLRNARAQEKRLLDLLSDRTGSLADVIAVENQLATVRQTIEQIEAQERLLEGQIAYATVKLSITTRYDAPAVGAGGRIARAAREGVENAGAFLVNAAVVAATAGPTLLLLAAIGAVLYYALLAVLRRRAAARPRPPVHAGPPGPYPSGPAAAYGPYGPMVAAYGPYGPQGAPQPHGAPAEQDPSGPQGTPQPHGAPAEQDPSGPQGTPQPHGAPAEQDPNGPQGTPQA